MKIILFLIMVSLVVALGFLFTFFWAVRTGQYEDAFTPSMRILVDDDMLLFEDQLPPNIPSSTNDTEKQSVNSNKTN